MRVKSCEASDNQNRPIELSDNDGCVLRPKMVSKFMKMRSTDPRATVVTYAFFHAFKFPDSMAVHIRYICYNFTISFEFKAIKKTIRHQDPRVKKIETIAQTSANCRYFTSD